MLKKYRYITIPLLLVIVGATSAIAIDEYLGVWLAIEIFIFLAVMVYVIAKDRSAQLDSEDNIPL